MMKLSPKVLHNLLFEMMRIRQVQLAIESRYLENEMRTPVHLCIGQEAVAVGVCANLKNNDYINSTHRGHGHYLAKGGSLRALIAELYGRESGCSKGRGGSMHLVDAKVGHYGSSSIVGGGIPVGTGMGLAIKMQKKKNISVIFFGDGAADEGVLYESINFAVLKKLPVIFILENNQYSVCSHISARQAGENIFHAMPAKLLMTKIVNGNDVRQVYDGVNNAVIRARTGRGPSFIECRTYRIRGHAGCETQDVAGYRTVGEIDSWKELCPVASFQKKLLKNKIITPNEINKMERKIENQIKDAFDFALRSPLPAPDTLPLYLFNE
ncbi:MAG: thiamine pyrophosphate-dependent dehydrogenase E1 component subunit alpha [Deltaproteobacteria bacterium]|nr:thiamine pyrophosphate-dependent dehydrogenase E1 component subunit alpha [Deltaproteobacteria bacterium]